MITSHSYISFYLYQNKLTKLLELTRKNSVLDWKNAKKGAFARTANIFRFFVICILIDTSIFETWKKKIETVKWWFKQFGVFQWLGANSADFSKNCNCWEEKNWRSGFCTSSFFFFCNCSISISYVGNSEQFLFWRRRKLWQDWRQTFPPAVPLTLIMILMNKWRLKKDTSGVIRQMKSSAIKRKRIRRHCRHQLRKRRGRLLYSSYGIILFFLLPNSTIFIDYWPETTRSRNWRGRIGNTTRSSDHMCFEWRVH